MRSAGYILLYPANAVKRQNNLSSATRRSRGAEKGTTPKRASKTSTNPIHVIHKKIHSGGIKTG